MATNYDLEVADASTPIIQNPRTDETVEQTGTRLTWQICVFLTSIVTTLVYLNSFQAVILFDDTLFINQPFSHRFWSSLFAPEVISRPLIGLSLYINYKISGDSLWSYHLFNLLIHLTAALALFGIVRETLSVERLRDRFANQTNLFGLIVALLWAVHPLQTQSVSYIIQRCESLMGMFYLLTLYFAIRSFAAGKKARWFVAAILACAGGMLSKQVMVTAPVIVILYDWIFFSSSLKELLQRRGKLYAGLASTWALLALTTIASPTNQTAGFAVQTITPLQYLQVEFAVIVHYLKLAIYPASLCLDYSWSKATTLQEMMPYAALVSMLVALTAYGTIRRKPIAFPAAWFFLILALTSSIVPFDDPAFEHRMYLSLAGVVSFVVFSVYWLGAKFLPRLLPPGQTQAALLRMVALVLVTAAVTMLGVLTYRRNLDYQSALGMWLDVVQKRPQNARALNNVGKIFLDGGEYDKAVAYLSKSNQYNPADKNALYNLSAALALRGDYEAAKTSALEVLRIDPEFPAAHYTLGLVALGQNNTAEAKAQFLEVLRGNPDEASANTHLGRILLLENQYVAAEAHFRQVTRVNPNSADAHFNLGVALLSEGRDGEAIPEFLETVRLNPRYSQAYFNLGLAFDARGRVADAAQSYRVALEINPDSPQALNQLAYILATADDPRLRNPDEAVRLAQKSVELMKAQNPIPFNTLAKAYAEAGRFPEAIQTARKAIEVATKTGNKEVAASAEACLKLYQAGHAR